MDMKALRQTAQVFTNPFRYRVLEAIEQAPCSTRREIAERLGVPVEVVTFHVQALAAYGAVGPCQDGKLTADTTAPRVVLDNDFREGKHLS